jgi:hypothetical protein
MCVYIPIPIPSSLFLRSLYADVAHHYYHDFLHIRIPSNSLLDLEEKHARVVERF